MATGKAAAIPTFSRFSALELDEESHSDDEGSHPTKNSTESKSNAAKNAKKRARKKKKAAANSADKNEVWKFFDFTINIKMILKGQ